MLCPLASALATSGNVKGPSAIIVAALFDSDFFVLCALCADFGFAVDWMRKDLKIALEEAKKNGSPLPVTKIVDTYYEEIQKMGGNRWDTSSLIRRFRKK